MFRSVGGRRRGILDAGLPGRRHPFRAKSPAEQQEVDDAIASVLTWVQDRVRWFAESRARQYGLDDQTADDLTAEVMAELWRWALPGYDRQRGDLIIYLANCITNGLNRHTRLIMNHRDQTPADSDLLDLTAAPATNPVMDERIEQFASKVMQEPENYLAPRDARLLRAWLNKGEMTQTEFAAALGYAPRTLRHALQRIRATIITAAEMELDWG